MVSDSSPMLLASTLIIAREGNAGAPELLMLERSSGMRFAAGALVFPGGRLDDVDIALAAELGNRRREAVEDIASRIAAIRETIEETGIAIGLDPVPDSATILMLRDALAEGASFATLIAEAGLRIDLDAMALFARWQPPVGVAHRRFDTRFYVAPAPADAVELADGTENVHAFWASADSILADARAGRHTIIFPTICTLFRLAQLSSFDDIARDADRHGQHLAATEIIERDGGRWFTIPHDIGFPVHSLLNGVLPLE